MKDTMILTKFQRWVLKRICKKLVVQGPWHKKRITEYYRIMTKAAQEQFTEDNKSTLDTFLSECHVDSLGDKGLLDEAFDALNIVRDMLNQKNTLLTFLGLSPLLDKKIAERLR